MARTRVATNPHQSKPKRLLDRLRNKNQAKVTTSQSTNPITGTTTTTQTTKTHPKGYGHRGHGGEGPMASNTETHYTGGSGTTGRHQKRKPSMGDKMSGAMMKLRGSLTGQTGKKAAGTRRMHGTDGKGGHHKNTATVAA